MELLIYIKSEMIQNFGGMLKRGKSLRETMNVVTILIS